MFLHCLVKVLGCLGVHFVCFLPFWVCVRVVFPCPFCPPSVTTIILCVFLSTVGFQQPPLSIDGPMMVFCALFTEGFSPFCCAISFSLLILDTLHTLSPIQSLGWVVMYRCTHSTQLNPKVPIGCTSQVSQREVGFLIGGEGGQQSPQNLRWGGLLGKGLNWKMPLQEKQQHAANIRARTVASKKCTGLSEKCPKNKQQRATTLHQE